jgi:nucleoside-diphosphate-sugar epimerase
VAHDLSDDPQTRDFAHVSDVVDTIIKATSSKLHMNGGLFNIGSGRAIAIDSLARRLTDICGRRLFSKTRKT